EILSRVHRDHTQAQHQGQHQPAHPHEGGFHEFNCWSFRSSPRSGPNRRKNRPAPDPRAHSHRPSHAPAPDRVSREYNRRAEPRPREEKGASAWEKSFEILPQRRPLATEVSSSHV